MNSPAAAPPARLKVFAPDFRKQIPAEAQVCVMMLDLWGFTYQGRRARNSVLRVLTVCEEIMSTPDFTAVHVVLTFSILSREVHMQRNTYEP